jgi:riboflavin kinase/FMN adenylyltransferase
MTIHSEIKQADDLDNYTITGTVVEGKKLGREIGFPTANILPDADKPIPACGVYAVEVITEFGCFAGMLNIGVNPTIDSANQKTSFEVHIIDFNKDIYNKTISVIIKKKLRDEIQFKNIEQLVSQMKLDKEATLRF